MKRRLQALGKRLPLHRKPSAEPGKFSVILEKLGGRLGFFNPVCLLLTWDVGGMSAALLDTRASDASPLAEAASRQPRFAQALDEVLHAIGKCTLVKPRVAILAARHLLPTVLAELPVQPDKPRRPEQMRELLQADLEPVLAEFGSLWSMGALLQARGFLTVAERERVTMEESIRRQQRGSQLRYGEIAIELGLIDRNALDECLELQASLQNLDAHLAAGWRGRLEDKHPLWLASGVGQATYDEWREALAERGIRLKTSLPLAWLASTPQPVTESATDKRRESWSVDLELHAEEVVAIQRRNGLIQATRSEGRVERALSSDWLHRMVADWTSEARIEIRLHCLHEIDDPAIAELAENLSLLTGHPCGTCGFAETRSTIRRNLLREANSPTPPLPRIAPADLRGNLLNNPDARRLLALGGVLLALLAVEGGQQYRLTGLEKKMADFQTNEKKRAATTQLTAQANIKLVELAKNLDTTRRELEPLLAERSRLNRIMTMRKDLPDLMYQLAQAVGNDAVIEEIHNDSTQSQSPAIQVVAWSPSYTGAQDFVNRMATLAREMAYGVAQMEIKERKGRDNRKGHEVRFWLLFEENELEGNESSASNTAAPGTTPMNGGGISSQSVLPGGKP